MRTSVKAATAAALVAVASVSAQRGPLLQGLSTPCQTGVASLVATDLSTCLSLPAFLTKFETLDNSSSIVAPFDGYFSQNICPKAACSQSTIDKGKSTVQQSCSTELQAPQFNGAQLIAYMLNNYNMVRNAACLDDSNNKGTLCLTQSLTTFEKDTKQNLTFSSLSAALSDPATANKSFEALAADKNGFCTDCTHALIATLTPDANSTAASKGLVGVCGPDFADGKVPASVKSSASTSTTTNPPKGGNGAMSLQSGAAAVLAIAAVAGFALF